MVTLEYCSLRYFQQWKRGDERFFQALNRENAHEEKFRAVSEATRFYGVARNLQRQFDVGRGVRRFEPIVSILDKCRRDTVCRNRLQGVSLVSRQISSEYGDLGVLSLTTKLL